MILPFSPLSQQHSDLVKLQVMIIEHYQKADALITEFLQNTPNGLVLVERSLLDVFCVFLPANRCALGEKYEEVKRMIPAEKLEGDYYSKRAFICLRVQQVDTLMHRVNNRAKVPGDQFITEKYLRELSECYDQLYQYLLHKQIAHLMIIND